MPAGLIPAPEGAVVAFTPPSGISGPRVTSGLPTPRGIAKRPRGVALYPPAVDRSGWVRRRLRAGLAILVGEGGNEGLGFRTLGLGLAWITLRRR